MVDCLAKAGAAAPSERSEYAMTWVLATSTKAGGLCSSCSGYDEAASAVASRRVQSGAQVLCMRLSSPVLLPPTLLPPLPAGWDACDARSATLRRLAE